MEKIILSPGQKDALQEVANIGASHAATVLSQMINREINIGIPKVDIIPLEKTIDCVKDQEIVVGVFLKISDEIPSYTLLLISQESAFTISNMLMGQEPDPSKEILSEMDKSALNEVGNVMMCAFFDSLTELLGVSLIPGPPALAYDMPAAVMDYVLIQMGELANEVVVFDCDVSEEGKNSFKIDMFLMPEPNSIKIILEKLGMG